MRRPGRRDAVGPTAGCGGGCSRLVMLGLVAGAVLSGPARAQDPHPAPAAAAEVPAGGTPPAAAAPPVPAAQVDAGRRAYTSLCVRCHGINLVSNGIGFDLRQFPAHDKARYLRSVNQGLRAMPAWQGIATPEQIEAIWVYIGSVNGWEGKAP